MPAWAAAFLVAVAVSVAGAPLLLRMASGAGLLDPAAHQVRSSGA